MARSFGFMCLLFDEILDAFFKSNRSAAPHGCYVECCSKHYLACQAEINILDGAGGVIIRLGFTSSKAFINILGEGVLPNKVTCVPTAVAVRKSKAHPYAWAKGRKESTFSPFFKSSVRIPKVTFPARLLPVIITPLLNPVVPEV